MSRYQTIDTFSQIGKLAATHGLEGNIAFVHRLKGKKLFQNLPFVFIELKNKSYIPFRIVSSKVLSETDAIVRFEGIDTVEKAKKIAGKHIFLPTEAYDRLQPAEQTLDFKGFVLYDQYDKKTGVVESVTEYPGQLMANVILTNGKEALIPIVEQHIINIDGRKKELTLQIPDGLIEIYL